MAGLALLFFLSLLGTGSALYSAVLRDRVREDIELKVFQRTKELEEKMASYEQAAVTDALTGLLNRRGGEEAVAPHIARSRRINTAISFILIDIDNFKSINDTYGHSVGDSVLEAVAKTTRQHLRTSDLAIRWGGEELLVVLPDTDLAGAVHVAEKLRVTIALLDFESSYSVTASFGCSELGDDDFQVALSRADMQMYMAKSQGRNRVCPTF